MFDYFEKMIMDLNSVKNEDSIDCIGNKNCRDENDESFQEVKKRKRKRKRRRTKRGAQLPDSIVGGKGMSYAYIEESLERNKYQIQVENNIYKKIFLLGYNNAMIIGRELKRKKIVEELVAVKQDIRELELEEDKELFCYELQYQKGYLKGLGYMLETIRYYYSIKTPIYILGSFENDEMIRLCSDKLLSAGFEQGDKTENRSEVADKIFYFTNDINQLIEKYKSIDHIYFDVVLNICYEEKFPALETFSNLDAVDSFRINMIWMGEKKSIGTYCVEMLENVCFNV